MLRATSSSTNLSSYHFARLRCCAERPTLLVLNTIEFWSGSNLCRECRQDGEHNGQRRQAVCRYHAQGRIRDKGCRRQCDELTYNEKDNTWAVEKDGTTTVLLKMKGNDTAQIYLPGGKTMDVTLDKQGLYEARMAVNEGVYFAAR